MSLLSAYNVPPPPPPPLLLHRYGDSFIEQLRLQILLQLQQLVRTEDDFRAFDGCRNPLPMLVKPHHVIRVCTVADPNYGEGWFHCKRRFYEAVHDVFSRAKDLLSQQVSRSVGRSFGACVCSARSTPTSRVAVGDDGGRGKACALTCLEVDERA